MVRITPHITYRSSVSRSPYPSNGLIVLETSPPNALKRKLFAYSTPTCIFKLYNSLYFVLGCLPFSSMGKPIILIVIT